MDGEKKFGGLMKVTIAAYVLVLLGFIEIAAVIYLLFLLSWFAREMYRGFIIGQVERKEYKERERAWQKNTALKVVKKDVGLELAETASE
jgi:hypothetical protein